MYNPPGKGSTTAAEDIAGRAGWLPGPVRAVARHATFPVRSAARLASLPVRYANSLKCRRCQRIVV